MQLPGIPPALALSLLLSVIYGALFHLWRGRTWGDLLASILVAMLGMVLGQVLGPYLGLGIGRIGQVYVLEGTIVAWVLMLAASLLRR
ncbi:MAG: hypothetical protein GY759_17445 [Chloroflexi bacterium]|nr:hypothetical protein [Chloroflexota bacterium]